MSTKRRRPTRAELDERLRIALERIPATFDGPPSEPVAARAGTEPGEWRIVSGTVQGPGAAED
jgi:hypothetical protein